MRVWLVGPGGRFPPGDVPPGTYAVTAFFDVTSPVEAGSVTVAAGERRVVSCSKNMMLCSVKSP